MKRSHKGKKVTPSVKGTFRKRPPKPEPDDVPKPGAGGKFKPGGARKRLKGVML